MSSLKLKLLLNSLATDNFDSFLVCSSFNIFYLTGYNGFSKEEREAFILITKNGNYLFTDARYINEVSSLSDFEVIEISSKNPFSKAMEYIAEKNKLKTTGFESNNLTTAEYLKFKKIFKKLKPADSLLTKLRAIKTDVEIAKLKRASRFGDLAFEYILKEIKPGVTEKLIASKIEIFFKEACKEASFTPIVAFNENSAIPHHANTNKKLKKGVVLLDFGVKVDGYCSDMTRTVFLGPAPKEFKRMYNTVFEAQAKAIEYINRHSSIVNNQLLGKDVDKVARDYIVSKDFPSIPHSLGHGIGIEVHEAPHLSPNSKEKLENGMVFSIEPGIYVPKIGGVRIEDLFLLTETGLEKMTHSPTGIIEL